jgi:PTS system nitrogen regulatory IIA component
MKIKDVLKESCVVADLAGQTKNDVLKELAVALKDAGQIKDVDAAVEVMLERERLGSTGIGDGIAIPHGKLKGLKTILCAFGRSLKGVPFDSVDRKPVHIFFLLLAPEDSAGLHLKMLSRISRVLRDPAFRRKLLEQPGQGDLYADIVDEDEKFS